MKIKFKKYQKGKFTNRINSKLTNIFEKNKSFFYLKTLDFGRITVNEIKAFKQILTKKLKKNFSRVVFNFNPNIPITKKPIEVRMGKGKGSVDSFIMKLNSGVVLCRIESVNFFVVLKALKQAKKRFSLKTKVYFF